MNHNVGVRPFAEVAVDNYPARSVLVRRCKLQHNNYLHARERASTGVLVRGSGLGGRVIHDLCNNNVERPVQPSPWGAQPHDLHADSSPSLLEVIPVPFVDGPAEVESPAVSEDEPRPERRHTTRVAP